MLELIRDTSSRYNYVVLTPNPSEIIEGLASHGLDAPCAGIRVTSASHDEVLAAYPGCDFGLVLRAKNVVNRVACPTKLIEYLAHGVIPVLASAEIGDLASLGMRFITDEQLRNGPIPCLSERRAMAQANFALLERLSATSHAGISQIRLALLRSPALKDNTLSQEPAVQAS